MKCLILFALILGICAEGNATLVEKNVEYRDGDILLEGYFVYDDSVQGKRPGVLVVHEWWGLNDYIKRRARQLAETGYSVFAVDMFGKGIVTNDPDEASRLAGQFKDKNIMRRRIKAGLDVLAGHDLVDSRQLAAIGFCFGGTTVMELAYSGADIKGAVSFHGSLPIPSLGDIDRIKAGILVLHGYDDPFVSSERIALFQKSMKEARADWQLVVYGGAKHGFTNPDADKVHIDGIAYNEKAAFRAWNLMKAYLQEIF